MPYSVYYEKRFARQFRKLDRPVQILIARWIRKNLENTDDPRRSGRALSGDWKGYWRYRIGDYRLIVHIDDIRLVIIAVEIAHRKEVYQ